MRSLIKVGEDNSEGLSKELNRKQLPLLVGINTYTGSSKFIPGLVDNPGIYLSQ